MLLPMKKDDSRYEELSGFAKAVGSKSLMSDIVGMPDAQDKEYIRKLLVRYDKRHPGVIRAIVHEAKEDFKAQGGRVAEWGEVNKDAHGRTLFELPEELMHDIEKAYPTMFRDTKHFRWFVKHFKELLIPEKY